MFAALRDREFSKLALLYTAVCFLEWFGSVALMALVFGETGSALAATALLLCKQVVPGVVIARIGGRLDELITRSILRVTLICEALVLLAIVVAGGGVSAYVLAAVAGTLGAASRVALRADFSRALTGEAFRAGNAAVNIGVSATAIAGPAAAATAVALFGTMPALVVGAGGMALLGVFAWATLPAYRLELHEEESDGDSASTPLRRASSLPLGTLLGFAGAVMLLCAIDEPAMMPLSVEVLGAGVAGYGAIYGAWGVGLAIGSLAFTRMLRLPMVTVAAAATALIGVAYVGMGLGGSLFAVCLMAALGGFGNGFGWVALVTAVQESAADGEEARVAARFESISMVAPAIGITVGGVLSDAFGPASAFVLPGVAVLTLVAAGVLFWRVRSARLPLPVLSATANGGSV